MPLLLTASADQSDQTAEPLLIALCGSRDHSWQLCTEGEYSCGSSPADDIRIELSGIERGHCRLIYRAGQLYVQRGEGRIWVHELPVSFSARLCEGDTLSLGGVSLRFEGVVTAWIRGGRRQPAAPEQLEAATPRVQFIGHSNMPFGRLGSVLAPNVTAEGSAPQPPPVPRQLIEELSAKESRLVKREQAVSEAEASIARILDELEQARNTERAGRQELALRFREIDEQRQRLDQGEARLKSRQQELLARESEVTAFEHTLHSQSVELNEKQQTLQQTASELRSQQQQIHDLDAAIVSREQLLHAREQSVRLRLQELDIQERALQTARQQLVAREELATERERQLVNFEQRKTELEQQSLIREQTVAELQFRLTDLEHRRADLERESIVREQKAAELQLRLTDLDQRKSELERESSVREQKAAELQLRLTDLEHRKSEIERESSFREQKVADLQLRLTDLEHRKSEIERESSSREQKAAELQLRLTNLEHRKSEIERESSFREQKAAELQLRLTDLEHRKSELERESSFREQKAAELQLRLTGLEHRKSELERESSFREQKAAELQFRLTGLEQRKAELEPESSVREQRDAELRLRLIELEERKVELERECLVYEQRAGEVEAGLAQRTAELRETEALQRSERELELEEQSRKVLLLTTQLAEANAGLREREGLIRQMYARLTQQGHGPGQDLSTEPVHTNEVGLRNEAFEKSAAMDAAEPMSANESAPLGDLPDSVQCVSGEDHPTVISEQSASRSIVADSQRSAVDPPPQEDRRFPPASTLPTGILSSDLLDLLNSEPADTLGAAAVKPEEGAMPTTYSSAILPQGDSYSPADSDLLPGSGVDNQSSENPQFRDGSSEPLPESDVRGGDGPEDEIRAYMSQLLVNQSERRATGGQYSAAPGRSNERLYADQIVRELRKKSEKKGPAAVRPTVSFIERFMSSERKPWEEDTSVAVAELEDTPADAATAQEAEGETEVAEQRQKMDIQKLRKNMDWFRSVSSRAATNAVVHHSLKKSRGGLMPRAGIVSVFMVSTILLARGPMLLGQEYPLVLLGNILLLLGSSIELARKMTQVIWMHATAPRTAKATLESATEQPSAPQPVAEAEEGEEPLLF